MAWSVSGDRIACLPANVRLKQSYHRLRAEATPFGTEYCVRASIRAAHAACRPITAAAKRPNARTRNASAAAR